MKISKNISLLRSRSTSVASGVLFVGSHDSNLYLVIRCPIHVALVIEKAFRASSIPTRFYSGSVTISQLVLPGYVGKFIYRDSSGMVKKYNAAFVYPLDLNHDFCEFDFSFISSVLSVFTDYKYGYYDEKDRSIQSLFKHLCPDYISYVESYLAHFVQSVPGSPTD